MDKLLGQLDYVVFCAACTAAAVAMAIAIRRAWPRQIMTIAGALLTSVLIIGWVFVEQAAVHERNRLRRMVEGFAPTYARELERMGHARIALHTPADDPAYLRMIQAQTRWLAANPIVSDIYTFRLRADGNVILIVDSETDYDRNGRYEGSREARTPIGEVFGEPSHALQRAFGGAVTFDAEPYTDRWGTWVSAHVPMYDDAGRVEAVVGVDFPAADWKQAIQQARLRVIAFTAVPVLIVLAGASFLAALRANLDAALLATRAKTEFLAHMSHEIRTPLTAILGFCDILLDQNLEPRERLESLQIIRRNGDHLLAIINDILDLSKIEAGKLQLERIACSPAQIVTEVASAMRHRAQQKGLAFDVQVASDIPRTIRTDPTRLRQILLNLCGNAVKFTSSGSVRLVCRLAPAGCDARPRVIFDVIDTGIGIEPARLHAVFEPFTQGDASMSRRFGGSGLGLNICKRLAAMLGGDIIASSAPGRGSTFSVELPCETLDAAATPRPPGPGARTAETSPAMLNASSDRPLEGARILLAEDGPDNQRLILFHLQRAGAQVQIADNGRDAMRQALRALHSDQPFHVILMDMQMPEVDGYEASRRLRAGGYSLPIIALTAHAMAGDRERCLQSGCDDYAAKPLNTPAFLQTVRRWFDHASKAPQGAVTNQITRASH